MIVFILVVGVSVWYLKYQRVPKQVFTLQSLKQFNGANGKTYIAVDKLVFDVTASDAYKPGGAYAVLAGADCSVCLAKMSLEAEHLNKSIPLSKTEQTTLAEWSAYMKKKYSVVGLLEPY